MTLTKLVEAVGRVLTVERTVGSDLSRAAELLRDCPPAATVFAPMAVELAAFPGVIEGVLWRLGADAEVP
jgi:hypothetical protein